MADLPGGSDKMRAGLKFIQRTGATGVQIRYSDDDEPTVWLAVGSWPGDRHEVDAALDPERAILRLCERLCDGGMCTHCGRPTGLDPDTLDRMPMDQLICWYQYDPGAKRFIRGCA